MDGDFLFLYSDFLNYSFATFLIYISFYPFAIDLRDPYTNNSPLPDFLVPIEKKAVDVTYPTFKNWVESKGSNDRQWYLYPVED